MALRNLKVDSVMPGSNGHNACAKLHIDSFIFYDGCSDGTVNPLKINFVTMFIILIAGVFRMHDHIFVAELCFRTGSGYGERPVF